MMTIDEIKAAIEKPLPAERAEVERFLEEAQDDA